MKLRIPEKVLSICSTLHAARLQGWIVGGAVRDLVMGREPHDYDIATSARPEQVAALFHHTVLTGEKHGTVTVIFGGEGFEVTTFRSDGDYSDGRRPDDVRFVATIEEDLSRRDFAMNAIAYDPLREYTVDPFGGVSDIVHARISAVGNPLKRFAEDGLRVLRAARFSSTLGFTIQAETLAAIGASLDSYRRVAVERVQSELVKMLLSERPSPGLNVMADTGILKESLPEMLPMMGCEQNRYHAYDVWRHTMAVLDASPPAPTVRLAALFHDICKPATKGVHPVTRDVTFYNHEELGAELTDSILHRLKFPTDTRQSVVQLVRHHLIPYQPGWAAAAIRRWVRRVGPEYVAPLLALGRADIAGKGPAAVALKVGVLDELERRVGELQFHAPIVTNTTALAVNGSDVMRELGLKPGPAVGAKLRELLELVTDNPELNEREALLSQLRASI